MPVLQLDDQQFPLSAGANRIGAGAGADIAVPGYSVIPVEAVIEGGASPTIRRAEDTAHEEVARVRDPSVKGFASVIRIYGFHSRPVLARSLLDDLR